MAQVGNPFISQVSTSISTQSKIQTEVNNETFRQKVLN